MTMTPLFAPYNAMDTAPKDGTVVLTNEGSAKYLNDSSENWHPLLAGWHLCTADGVIPNGPSDASMLSPAGWIEFPHMPATRR